MRLWFQGDRLEYRAREGKDGYLWDIQGYYGGDIDKFWFKSEGEGSFVSYCTKSPSFLQNEGPFF